MEHLSNLSLLTQSNNQISLTGYIIGMVLGSILILSGIGYAMFFMIKAGIYRQLLKRVGANIEQKINDDIMLWSKKTNKIQSHNKFFKSPLLRQGNKRTFKLDSLLLTDKALIVIEIKSIRGGIRGSSQDSSWLKIIGNNEVPITNVVTQNDHKISQLRNILGVKVPMISLIIFSNKATFIDLSDLPGHVVVTKHIDIFLTLDDINQSLTSQIDKELKKKILKKIKSHIVSKHREKNMFEEEPVISIKAA